MDRTITIELGRTAIKDRYKKLLIGTMPPIRRKNLGLVDISYLK